MTKRRVAYWTAAIVTAMAVALAVGIKMALRAPQLKARIVAEMARQLDSDVTLDQLHVSIFPVIRLRGAGLVVRRRFESREPPTITIGSFVLELGLVNLLHHRASVMHVDQLRITIPPRVAGRAPEPPRPSGAGHRTERIDRLTSSNAELVFLSSDASGASRVFPIHDLTVDAVAFDSAMPFRATLTNPKPEGLIATQGTVGPWNGDNPGDTPVEGNYVYANADFDTIDGLGGTLSSIGTFSGRLAELHVNGTTDTPDFQLDRSGHTLPLKTTFRAMVNGTNGDTTLEDVRGTLADSAIVVHGSIMHKPGIHGPLISLAMSVPRGRIQDLLKLTMPADQPMLTGAVTLSGSLRLPPGAGRVLDRLALDGQFALSEATFTNPQVQDRVRAFSRRGQGKSANEPIGPVATSIDGTFRIVDSRLSLKNVHVGIPGAALSLQGTSGLRDGALDLTGELRLKATVSQAAGGGWKSFLLSPVDRMFRSADAGAVFAIYISGTQQHPKLGIDFRKTLRDR